MGGRLRFFTDQWRQITDDKWVLSTIAKGYKLEFQSWPPLSGIKETRVNAKNQDILNSEIQKLLEKAAIEPVPFAQRQQGFYSTFFLVPKKSGELRAVINLRPLNQYLKTQHFKMDTMKTVLNLVQKGDWAISVDLKDAYFHILIHPKHKKFLRFCIQGKAYQYRALAFGPKTSPRVFTKVVAVVAAHLRMQSIRLSVYLDDWLAVNALRKTLLKDRENMLNLLSRLGFLINSEKSNLEPSQEITYIGGRFRLDKGIVMPTPDRLVKLRKAVMSLMGFPVSAKQYLHTLRLMASCIELIPNARLYMRPVQLHLLHWWKPASRDLEVIIPKSQHLVDHLGWWLLEANTSKGRLFAQSQMSKTISTDASNQGWGGNLEHQIVPGTWSNKMKGLHINCLELEAVILTMQKFLPQLTNQSVLIRSDSTTVIQYINRQGGTHSPQLCYKTWELWQMAIRNNIVLKGVHIHVAGKLNVLPDQLSRILIRPTEWTLKDAVLREIFHIWGTPMIDLFASIHNKKMQVFCSWDYHPQAFAMDALTVSWTQMFAYAFPPICLIPKVLEHMKQGPCQIILIAPQWPRRHWYLDLLQMCIAEPIRLPQIPDLLSQPGTIIYHPDPKVFNLNAWLLSTDSFRQRAFQRKLEICCLPPGDLVHRKTTLVISDSSVVGVLKNRLIHIQHL